MFKEGRPLEDVAVDLDIESLTVLSYYQDLLKLTNMRKLVSVYNEIKDDILTI